MATDVDAASEMVQAWVAQGPGTPAALRWTERVTAQSLWELCGAARGAGVAACALALEDAAAHGLVLRLAPPDSPWAAAPFPHAPPAPVFVRNPCAAADGRAGLARVAHGEGLSAAELCAALAEDEEDRVERGGEEVVDDANEEEEEEQKWLCAADAVMSALGVQVRARNEESSSSSGGGNNSNSNDGVIAIDSGGDDDDHGEITAGECCLPWKMRRDAPGETAERHGSHGRHRHAGRDASHPGYKIKGKVMIALDPETLSREQAELREVNRHKARQGRARKSSRSSVPYAPR